MYWTWRILIFNDDPVLAYQGYYYVPDYTYLMDLDLQGWFIFLSLSWNVGMPYFMKPNLHHLFLIAYFWWHLVWWYVLWSFQNRMALKYPFPEVNIVLCSWPCLLTLLLPSEFVSKEILRWYHDLMTLYLSCCWLDDALLDFWNIFDHIKTLRPCFLYWKWKFLWVLQDIAGV